MNNTYLSIFAAVLAPESRRVCFHRKQAALPSIVLRFFLKRCVIVVLALLLAGLAQSANAATPYYWSANGGSALGGVGTWDTSSASWTSTYALPATAIPWVNSLTTSEAYFGGPSILTIGSSGIQAYGMTTNSNNFFGGYQGVTIGGSGTLSLGTVGIANYGGLFYISNSITESAGTSFSSYRNGFIDLTGGISNTTSGGTLTFFSGSGAGYSVILASGNITSTAGSANLLIGSSAASGGAQLLTELSGSNSGLNGGTITIDSTNLVMDSQGALGTGTTGTTTPAISFAKGPSTNPSNLTYNDQLLTTGVANLTVYNNISLAAIGNSKEVDNTVVGSAATSGTTTFSGTLSISPNTSAYPVRTATLYSAQGGSVLFSGNIVVGAGTGTAGGITTEGSIALTGTNTYTGSTVINSGTLNLGNGGATGSISSSSALALNGATLAYTRTGNTTQTFASTAISGGQNEIIAATGDTLALGAITRTAGATVDFSTTGGSVTTSTANTSGILGGWATVNGTDWATGGGTIAALGSYTSDTWGAGNNTTVTTNDTPSSGSITNSLRFNAAGANTITLSGTNIITSGGILVTTNVGSNLSTLTGGTLEGASGADLVLIQNNAGGGLTIGSTIADNTTATGLTLSGTGLVSLTNAANTYTGPTVLNGGLVNVNTLAAAGTASSLGAGVANVTNSTNTAATVSGTYVIPMSSTSGLSVGQVVTGAGLAYGSVVTAISTNTSITVSQPTTAALTIGETMTYLTPSALVFNGGGIQYTGSSAATQSRAYTVGINGATFDASGSGTGALTISGTMYGSATSGITTITLTGTGTGVAGGTLSGIVANGNIGSDNANTAAGTSANLTSLVKNGSGTWIVSGSNTYTGATIINAGTLQVGVAQSASGGAIGQVLSPGSGIYYGGYSDVSIASGANLNLNGFNTGIGSLTGAGNVQLGSGTLYVGGSGTSPAAYSGVISGTGALNKYVIGTMTLSGSNTFTGATTIYGGIVNYQNATAFGTNSAITLSNSIAYGTVQVQGNIAGGSKVLTLVGPGAGGATGALENVSGNNTYAGQVVLTGATTISSDAGSLGLTYTGTITGAGDTLTLAGAGNGSIASNIGTTTGGLVVNGSGTWTLSGNNTYTGATTVSSGTLVVAGSTAAGSAVAVNGGILRVTGTVNGAVSVASGATLAGTGTIGALTVTGGSIINLQDGTTNTLHGSTMTFNTGTGNGVISIDVGSSATSDVIALTGAASLGSNLYTVNVNSLAGATTGTAYTFISASGGLTLGDFSAGTLTGTLAGDTLTFAGGGTAVTVTINAGASAPTVAYFNGATSDLNTATNFYTTVTGTTATSATVTGTTNVYFSANQNTNTSVTTTSGTVAVNSLNFGITSTGTNSGITVSGANAITITGSNVNGITGNQGITVSTGTDTISAPIALGASQTWEVDSGGTLTVSGTISGSSTNLTKTGVGALILTGASTYTGTTTISSGILQIGAGGTGANIASGDISNSGTLVFDLSTAYNLTNAISGNGAILDIGTGLLTLSGSNSSIGATTVATGTLSFGSVGSLSSGAISLAGGTGLQYTGTSSGTLNQNITITSGTGLLTNTGGNVLTLTGTLNKNGTTLDFGNGKFVVAGTITGTATHSDVVLGTATGRSTVGLTSTNSYNGPTTIYNGSTLLTGVTGALPTGTFTDLTLGSGTDGAVTNSLDLLGTSQTVASITGTGTGTTNQIISSNGSASTPAIGSAASGTMGNLTVNYTGTTTDTFTGVLGGTGTLTNFSLTKSGTGALALTSANTYTGGTTVSAGTLIVNNSTGSATGTGGLNVISGATLTGTGVIAMTGSNNATISGTVNVGNGLTTDRLTLTATSSGTVNLSTASLKFQLDNNSTNSSELLLGNSGSVVFGSTQLTLNMNGSNVITSPTDYILFASTVSGTDVYQGLGLGTVTGSYTLITSGLYVTVTGTNAAGYGGAYLELYNTGGGYDIVAVVPEPSTWALMLGGLAFLLLVQRTRRNKKV